MTLVSTSVEIQYDVRRQVSATVDVVYNTGAIASTSFEIDYDVRSRVTKSVSLLWDTHKMMFPSKVVSLFYDVRKLASKSLPITYGVRVPVAPAKSVSLLYGVRRQVSKSVEFDYDTEIIGPGTVTKSVEIVYHTLVTPTFEGVMATPIEVDSVPPQIVTTSF